MPVPSLYRILPEVILTITGVLAMLIESMLPKGTSRKPIGVLSLLGVIAALIASVWQLSLPPGTGYYNTVQTDAFSVFFHVVICSIVLVSILIAFDIFDGTKDRPAEYFPLVLFAAVGMCLMSSAVELLLVFIALEISSISTYILAAIRKHSGKSPEAGLKYFLLGSFATAFFLFGIALTFGATGTTNISDVAAGLLTTGTPAFATLAVTMILIGIGFKVSAAPFQVWTPDVYEGAPSPVVALMSTGPKVAAFAVLLRILYSAYPAPARTLAVACLDPGGPLHVRRQPGSPAPAKRKAHAGLLLDRSCRLHPGRFHRSFPRRSVRGHVLHRVLRRHERGRLCRYQSCRGFRRPAGPPSPIIAALAYRSPLLGGALSVFLISLIGIPLHRRILRQVLRLYRRPACRRSLARGHRPGEQWHRCLLLPAPAGLTLWPPRRRSPGTNHAPAADLAHAGTPPDRLRPPSSWASSPEGSLAIGTKRSGATFPAITGAK